MVTIPIFEDNAYCQWPPSPLNAEPQAHEDTTMLERIVELPITPAVIGEPLIFFYDLLQPLICAYTEHVVSQVAKAVEVGLGRPLSSSSTPSSPSSEESSSSSKQSPNPIPTLSEFAVFTSAVFRRAEVKMPVVLGTLVYIERAMPYLRISIEGAFAFS